MIIIIYSDTNAGSIEKNLGMSEYSYYFVLKEFRPILEQLGIVVTVTDPAREVDTIYRNAQAHGETCVFLSFSPPHKTEINLDCPTIPVFAWEFNTIPQEIWDNDPRNDWRTVFAKLGCAITHSNFTVATARAAMTPTYPIISAPAPVWDRFARLRERANSGAVEIDIAGTVIDTNDTDITVFGPKQRHVPKPNLVRSAALAREQPVKLHLDGVVYTSVFNPYDGRKNWFDMIGAFCWAFRDHEDAVLVLKLTHHDIQPAVVSLLEDLCKLKPYQCRVVLISGYLADTEYEKLVAMTSYVVNTSHGEGQCLPLMEFMSCGIPAITPDHTAMVDYINGDNAFVVSSSTEPSHWPHDPRQAYRTLRYRIDWGSLRDAYLDSYHVFKHDQARYKKMAESAVTGLQKHCSQAVIAQRLREFIFAHPRLTSADRATFENKQKNVLVP
ncbi:glycosyltransferase [Solimicrobium silvestre]|uniref:Glycosyl transferases group 1 n=1 Tax=Solimicrobium silvestre TaxID=2099400 RepID=A0A2S9H1V8_9BURK|nr:glycosyltransferase [Solimicrobium silvestre]PRC93962.1 Glycosyl transferases group 1 [Solimicrobium silvestre]